MISSAVKYRLIRASSPSRLSPAAARIRPLYWPSSSLRSLVWRFPRILFTSISGYIFFSCRVRLKLEHPRGLFLSSSVTPSGSTSTSLGSSLLENARSGSSSDTSIGISLRLCTERILLPSISALSSSFTKRPFPPTLSRVRSRMISPVVFMVSISTSSSGFCFFI